MSYNVVIQLLFPEWHRWLIFDAIGAEAASSRQTAVSLLSPTSHSHSV